MRFSSVCYKHRMPRDAISVTLDSRNLTWLKGRAGASGESVSKLLDQLVTAARQSGALNSVRSVVGTIDVDSSDPLLDQADQEIAGLFELSSARPLVVRERRSKYVSRPRTVRKRRG